MSRPSSEERLSAARAALERGDARRAARELERSRLDFLVEDDVGGLSELLAIARELPADTPREKWAREWLLYEAEQNIAFLTRRASLRAGKERRDPSAPAAVAAPPPQISTRAKRLAKLKNVLGYLSGIALVALAGFLVWLIVLGVPKCGDYMFECGPGDPSAAGVVDYHPYWSPDSRWVAFDRSHGGSSITDVYVTDSAGRRVWRLTRTQARDEVIGWIEAPLRVVYQSYTRAGNRESPKTIYTITLRPGARPLRLARLRARETVIALSHNGRRLLVVRSSRHGGFRYFLVDLARGRRLELPSGASLARGTKLDIELPEGYTDSGYGSWSPDDSALAYVTDNILVVVRGVHVRQFNVDANGGLSWSPDGRRLAYDECGWTYCDYGQISVLRLDNGSTRRLTGGESQNSSPIWSPDGGKIYYQRYATGSLGESDDGIRTITLTGKEDTKITSIYWKCFLSIFPDFSIETWTVSPDGGRIAYLLEEGDWWQLGIMNADGSGKTAVPTHEDEGPPRTPAS